MIVHEYPDTINLPFNFAAIRSEFLFLPHVPEPAVEDGYWAIIRGGEVVLEETPSGLQLPCGALPAQFLQSGPPHCIGTWRGKPLKALPVESGLKLERPFRAEPFNAIDDVVDIRTLTLAGLAKQILHWDRQSRHCSRCGSITEPITESWGKRCISCKAEHFPHIHPCAIILVKRGNELLLARKPEWAAGRYGLVAGFLEFGEALEECAAREVLEETGISIRNIRYVGSQNWPFPAQLMAGFVADHDSGEIAVDQHELEDARWFPRDALPQLPPKRSIARWIIDNFK